MSDLSTTADSSKPKVFISYSWTSQSHQDRVKEWADALLSQGVEVILDIYDLKEGHDKYAFMEKMVTDPNVSKVLIMCDLVYAKKADARSLGDTGVGTESQIISNKVYKSTSQNKFIPIVCEYFEDRTPCLPEFLNSRIYIDFSTDEKVNQNWEGLLRLIYDKPLHKKPSVGKRPLFLLDDNQDISLAPLRSAFQLLRQAILSSSRSINLHRRAFHDLCIEHADQLRIIQRPEGKSGPEAALDANNKLIPIRDFIVDWVLLESQVSASEEFNESLINLLERLMEIRLRRVDQTTWNETWLDGHKQFAYETFIYIIAALLKNESFKTLNVVYFAHYIVPEAERSSMYAHDRFTQLWTSATPLQAAFESQDQRRYYSPAAELIKRHSNRNDLNLEALIQADALTFIVSLLISAHSWRPMMLHYQQSSAGFPFFIRASQRKNFRKLAAITGISDSIEFKSKIRSAFIENRIERWDEFHFFRDFESIFNINQLDSLQ